ncbi:LOW QUALITY PROTEIN: endonuclease domain-containing 1 protein-like [Cyanistes caeruleus]|uniref:LOW QUALITY PROTEIN: endonuclease domain-containing 1 protein-like n=1 Tax=Cyanistes caeruleus TaxID=156563 RepID=UPI000CDA5AFF|nr:LOW QUALITY PROTEIN: endonuclease domain-containing 1 protein-like [Cyanistes caeruleus]
MLGLLLLQVLASCLWLGHSEVVNSFADCPEFFYAGTTPNDALHPQNPAWICQSYNDSYHYATLYDRDRRIPVYSAYKYQPGPAKRPPKYWCVEPQLINENELQNMEREVVLVEQLHRFTLEEIKKSQAVQVFEDYNKMTGLTHGHLSPNGHMDSKESKTATFTLTNIVPQDENLNSDKWSKYEAKTVPQMSQGCTTTYIITGAVPGNTYIADGRVNVPSHIWSAACCLVGNQPSKAWGAIAENDKNRVKKVSLGDLENMLGTLYRGRRVTLFNNACPRQ